MMDEDFALFQETQAEAFHTICAFARELAAGRQLTLGAMIQRMPLVDPSDAAETAAFLSEVFDFGAASPGMEDVPRREGVRPVPVLPSRVELAWLRGMVEDPEAAFLLPPALREKLAARLACVPRLSEACWSDVREAGDDIKAPAYQAKLACLAEALRRGRFVRYENVDRTGAVHTDEAARSAALQVSAGWFVWLMKMGMSFPRLKSEKGEFGWRSGTVFWEALQVLRFAFRDFCARGRRADEHGRLVVVCFLAGARHVFIEVRVAVAAEVQARVVLPDVDAFHAAAFRTLRRVFFHVDGAAEHAIDAFLVDARAMEDAVAIEVDGLGAGLEIDAGSSGRTGEARGDLFHVRRRHRQESERLRVARRFLVEVEKADDAALRVRRECREQAAEGGRVPVEGVFRAQEDGIVAPDDFFTADGAGKSLERLDARGKRRQAGLGVALVGIERVLEIIAVSHGIELGEVQIGRAHV